MVKTLLIALYYFVCVLIAQTIPNYSVLSYAFGILAGGVSVALFCNVNK